MLPQYDEQIIPQNNAGRRKDRDRKEVRQQNFDNHRPGLNSDEETTSERTFSGETTVKLDDNLVTKLQKPELQDIMQRENVHLVQGILTGTLNAITSFASKLFSIIPGLDQTDPATDQSSDSSKDTMLSAGGLPISTDQSGDLSKATTPSAGGQRKSSDQSQPNRKPDESFAVSSIFLRYIMEYQYEIFQKLENVCAEISFEVVSKAERNLKLFARDDLDKKRFFKTTENFIDFYQKQNQRMIQEDIAKLPGDKNEVISEARTKFSVVITPAEDPDKITIYGVKEKVEKAKRFLESKVGTLNSGVASPKNPTTERAPIEKVSFKLSPDLKLVVYQGDLTKEKVDAIVNPANDSLKHGGGAAWAIVKAGGRSIQDESDDIMKRRRHRPLQPGDAEVTGAGRLPCKFVVHAVGPIWSQHSPNTAMQLLYNAVSKSLYLAGQIDATSISIPAIGSGLYKVPVDICARVLFDAVINFSANRNKSIALKKIHFVNIDFSTNNAFVKEMEKRFPDSLLKDSTGQERQTRFGQQQITAQTTSSGTNSYGYQATYKGSSPNNPSGDNTGSLIFIHLKLNII